MSQLNNALNKFETLLNNPQSAAEDIIVSLEAFMHALGDTLQVGTLSESELISLQARVQNMLDSATTQRNDIAGGLRSVSQRLKAQAAYGSKK